MKKYLWLLPLAAISATAQTPVGNPTGTIFNFQAYNRPEACLPCHQRQYNELLSSVKSGYRTISPLMNGLESAANFINGGLLRPTYPDSTVVLPDGTPLNSNMFTTSPITEIRQVQSGFCYTCHDAGVEREGNNPATRVLPQLAGLAGSFQPTIFRPLRDYMLADSNGNQVIPPQVGGYPPAGAGPSLASAGVTCDLCHNVGGPDIQRSFYRDGFANTSFLLNESEEKVGPFTQPVEVKGDFHVSSADTNKINYLVSGAFCNACHDVRVPVAAPGDVQNLEYNINAGGSGVTYFRLENLSTEWQIGAYNSTNNPFGKVITCQACHMSAFPFVGGTSTYTVGDLSVTSPTPAIYFQNYAAVPGISTENNYPLSKRQVVNHYFTGVDVPLMGTPELQARLNPLYPDAYVAGSDEYGVPLSLAARRQALLDAATRVSVQKSDQTANLGQDMTVRVEAVALTGHRFPAGFSQERTAYVQMSVTDDNGFVLYKSGYVVDKPHPDTGETAPDGNLNDEDLEHVHAVVSGGSFVAPYATGTGNNGGLNQVFETGPDDGPDSRLFAGVNEGLVLFRNELTKVFLPGTALGRNDANGNPIVAQAPHYEETFNAALATTVDNYRSLQPLVPRTYLYTFTLPTQEELNEMGVTLKGPLHIHAQVNYEHFPPLFMRYIAKATGPNGPSGAGLNLLTEATIDSYLVNVTGISSDDTTATVGGVQ